MTPAEKPALLIIDSHAMAYRAYYALQKQNLTHPATGQPTAAIFGFFRMFFKILVERRPTFTAVVWDAPGPTFRHRISADYKATRKPMPEDLRAQIDEIKELCVKSGFTNLEISGYEADDLIGTLARRHEKSMPVLLLTQDKDCFQLLDENITMLRGAKGVTDFTIVDPDWVRKELGVGCAQITDYMGLVGDSSDNIPGARGVGPKSATALLQQFNTLDNLYEHLEDVQSTSLREKLQASRDSVFLSRTLATINTTIPEIEKIDKRELVTPDILSADVLRLFRNEGYNQIYADLNRALKARGQEEGDTSPSDTTSVAPGDKPTSASIVVPGDKPTSVSIVVPGDKRTSASARQGQSGYELIDTMAALEKTIRSLEKSKLLSVDTETDSENPLRARLVGISLAARKGRACYIPLPPADSPHFEKGLDLEEARPLLRRLLENQRIPKIGQNIKYDLLVLRRHGIEVGPIAFDTMIASYLLNPNVRRNNLDDMALDQLGHITIKYDEIVGSGKNRTTMDQIEPAEIRDYACEDADITLQLQQLFKKKLKENKLTKINEEIEIPLLTVLADMEQAGVLIDVAYFGKLSKEYSQKLNALEKSIHHHAGYDFNVNSTKEMQKVLFDELQLPRGRKTKTGYSTDQTVLEGLAGFHPIIEDLLEHRKYMKLKSTYVDALPELIHPETGRLHTSFSQTIAATGRLSSMEPNLQNIPIREQTGRAIRRGFIAAKDFRLLSLDYSQIELRLMAHYSGDAALLEAFNRDDIDVHSRTAASLFNVAESEVDADMRSQAKILNFSIIYGVTEFGLSRNLSIPRESARRYIEAFFNRYPGVHDYMEKSIAGAREKGFVTTLSGRRRQIPEINSTNRFRREGAERTAVNTPIQGTSADIIKLAMIGIQSELREKKLLSRMILQVHDELLFEVPSPEEEQIVEIARAHMERAMRLRVPLRVDWKFGHNWDEAH